MKLVRELVGPDVMALLRDLGIGASEGRHASEWLLRLPDGGGRHVQLSPTVPRITMRTVRGAPTASSRMLHVGDSATPSVLERAEAGQIDILTEDPPRAIIGGRTIAVPTGESSSRSARKSSRPAWRRWALERVLVLAHAPARQSELADRIGTQQQTISQGVRTLGHLVVDDGRGLEPADKRALLEHVLGQYPGPGGLQAGWYALDDPVEQARRAVEVSAALEAEPLLTGDVAADRLGPWKLPTSARIYISRPVDLSEDGFVPAPLEEASLITQLPQDPTVHRTSRASEGAALADAVLVCWELLQGRDVDSVEAGEHLKDLIVRGMA